MTKKRFYIQDERTIKDNKKYITENGYVLSFKSDAEEIVDLLNSLNDENEELQQREKTLEGMIRTFDEGCKEIYDDKCRLEKENEQLKQILDELSNMLQFDVENGIRSYPVTLSEYLSNALKELMK